MARSRIRPDQQKGEASLRKGSLDLVFVFALTQVTVFMADNLGWQGLLRGAPIISLSGGLERETGWRANVESCRGLRS